MSKWCKNAWKHLANINELSELSRRKNHSDIFAKIQKLKTQLFLVELLVFTVINKKPKSIYNLVQKPE